MFPRGLFLTGISRFMSGGCLGIPNARVLKCCWILSFLNSLFHSCWNSYMRISCILYFIYIPFFIATIIPYWNNTWSYKSLISPPAIHKRRYLFWNRNQEIHLDLRFFSHQQQLLQQLLLQLLMPWQPQAQRSLMTLIWWKRLRRKWKWIYIIHWVSRWMLIQSGKKRGNWSWDLRK